jgi:hypothetical protein
MAIIIYNYNQILNTSLIKYSRHEISMELKIIWLGNLRERDHWGDPDVDGRIILRWIFRKWEGVMGTGWSWLRIETGGGRLRVR